MILNFFSKLLGIPYVRILSSIALICSAGYAFGYHPSPDDGVTISPKPLRHVQETSCDDPLHPDGTNRVEACSMAPDPIPLRDAIGRKPGSLDLVPLFGTFANVLGTAEGR